jgi:hypothetical protein
MLFVTCVHTALRSAAGTSDRKIIEKVARTTGSTATGVTGQFFMTKRVEKGLQKVQKTLIKCLFRILGSRRRKNAALLRAGWAPEF